MPRPPTPPFTRETALAKVQAAEDAWNSRDPKVVAQAYTPDSGWQHAGTGQWYRSHGNEHWEFDADGYMRRRDMSANDVPILPEHRRIGVEG